MKKFIAYVCFIILVPTAFLLLFSFNVGRVFLNSEQIKSAVSTSGVYESASAYLQENILNESDVDKNSKKVLDLLEEAINSVAIQKISDDVVDQIYDQRNHPENITIKYTLLPNIQVEGITNTDRPIEKNFVNNNFFIFWGHLGSIILVLLAVTVLFLFFIMLLAPNWPARFVWVASITFWTLLLVAAAYGASLTIFKLIPGFVMTKILAIPDTDILAAISKLFDNFWSIQRNYYLVEMISLAIACVVFWLLSIIFHTRNTDIGLDKLDKAKVDITNLPSEGLNKKPTKK